MQSVCVVTVYTICITYFNNYNMTTCIKPVWNILTVNCITNSCIWNKWVTLQGIDYKLPDDDTIVSKHVGVW
jgi:hypothetical protein